LKKARYRLELGSHNPHRDMLIKNRDGKSIRGTGSTIRALNSLGTVPYDKAQCLGNFKKEGPTEFKNEK